MPIYPDYSICGFTYIEPNWRAIKESKFRKLFETLTQKSLDVWLGFAFERFCLKHAGICDPIGRIFGLMPHPKGFNHYTNHPDWTKKKEALARQRKEIIPEEGKGIRIFRNAVEYIRKSF